MARKKAEVQLLREIETQEEWEEVMAMEGLWVVDVYQEWCGPCQALVAHFRRLKNELGDQLLNFAMAKADTIDALEKYRGRCEPTFLFFAGGILTSYIHGADAPKVQRVITEQLASEHKILEGTGERKEVKDPVITRAQEIETERLAEAEAQKIIEEAIGITIAIITPDAVSQNRIDEIIAEIKEKGIDILAKEEREISFDEARVVYSNVENEPYFDELVKVITSGPSFVLLLTQGSSGITIVKDWKDLIGPLNVDQAKEEAPTSLRAKYGDKGYTLHGSVSNDAANRERALFFPNFTLPTYQKKKANIQRTLALIRPEAYANKSSEILQKITEEGFKVDMYKEVQLTKEQAAEFYKEHEQYAYFDSLVENMSSGPLLVLGLSKGEGIKAWRTAIGPSNIDEAMEKEPKSFRAQFPGASGMNQFHGSDSEEAAKEELSYFFPMEQTVAVIKPDAMGFADAFIARIQESGFRIAAKQETTASLYIVEAMYPKQKGESHYDDLVNFITSGPMLFMVLSREGAISGWRAEMGDTDPEAARNKNPDLYLRALYGKNILHNAVHGSSNKEHSKQEIRAVFGDLKFNEDGTLKGVQPDLDETSQVFDRDRSSDAGEDNNNSDAPPDAPADAPAADDAAQDVMATEEQQDIAGETNGEMRQQQRTPDGDMQHHDNRSHDGSIADTQETHNRPKSGHSSGGKKSPHTETEHDDKKHEPHGSDHDFEKIEGGNHENSDKNDHNNQEKERAESQGSRHSYKDTEADHQEGGYHGEAGDHNDQAIEDIQPEAVDPPADEA